MFGLELAPAPSSTFTSVAMSLALPREEATQHWVDEAVWLPGGSDHACGAFEPWPRETSPTISLPQLFHVDSSGRSCFSREEAARSMAYLKRIDLPERVRGAIATTPWHLPQKSRTQANVNFCNESVYGELSVLLTSGVVKMVQLEDE
jgi:hypothetical protein